LLFASTAFGININMPDPTKKIKAAAQKAASAVKTGVPVKAPVTKPTPTAKQTATPTKPLGKSPAPTDKEITTIIAKIKDGKFATSALGPLTDLLSKIKGAIKGDIIDIKDIGQTNLPIEFNPFKATSFSGAITFFNQKLQCTVIIGKLADATGKEKLGVSIDIALGKNYKVNQLYKKFNFFSALNVAGDDIGKFGTIDLPQPHIIFSTFPSYTNPETKAAIKAGVTIATRTKAATLMKLIRGEVNNLTGGNASKLPFLAKVDDNAAVAFDIAVGFTGTTFESFSVNVSLPMQLGIDIAKMRAQERNFKPGIKAPFEGLNKPIKEVTGILNKAPLSDIKDISVGNFVASVGVEKNSFRLSFGTELNVTTNADVRYGIMGTIGLTPQELAIELRKSPSIQSMPLGGGVSIENIALAVFTDFKLLVTGVPISGLGLLGEIKFPFEGDKVTIGLGGQVKASGDFMMMGSVQNLDAKKLAVFNAKMIENVARAVQFDTSKLTEAMKQMPTIKINDGFVYVATKQVTLGGRIFPLGLGVSLDVIIDKQKARLSVAGNKTELAFLGYLSEIKTPVITISGMGPDKKHGTEDDGPIIDFIISADKPLKSSFDMSGSVSIPAVKVEGKGDISLGLGRIGVKFASQVANLFKANFDVQLNIQKVMDSKIAFELNAEERKNFLGIAFKELEKAIVKAQNGAAKTMLEPLRILAKEIGKGVSNLNISLPKKIAASVVARTFSGPMEIDGGSLKLPVVGDIQLGIPKIEFSLKDPMKAIGKIAEKWANQIVNDMKKMGKELEKFGKEVAEIATKAGEEIKKGAETAVKETGQATTTAVKAVEKGAKSAGKAVSGWFGTKKKRTVRYVFNPDLAYKAPPKLSDKEIKISYAKNRESLIKQINDIKGRLINTLAQFKKDPQLNPKTASLVVINDRRANVRALQFKFDQLGYNLKRYNLFVANTPLQQTIKDFPKPINPEEVGDIPKMMTDLSDYLEYVQTESTKATKKRAIEEKETRKPKFIEQRKRIINKIADLKKRADAAIQSFKQATIKYNTKKAPFPNIIVLSQTYKKIENDYRMMGYDLTDYTKQSSFWKIQPQYINDSTFPAPIEKETEGLKEKIDTLTKTYQEANKASLTL
jgi:ElaB/YqjD/DUF883 family membrane-anchored ribosome-binding protein